MLNGDHFSTGIIEGPPGPPGPPGKTSYLILIQIILEPKFNAFH